MSYPNTPTAAGIPAAPINERTGMGDYEIVCPVCGDITRAYFTERVRRQFNTHYRTAHQSGN